MSFLTGGFDILCVMQAVLLGRYFINQFELFAKVGGGNKPHGIRNFCNRHIGALQEFARTLQADVGEQLKRRHPVLLLDISNDLGGMAACNFGQLAEFNFFGIMHRKIL